MRKHVVLLVVLALAAGACGNRTGDDDSAGPEDGATTARWRRGRPPTSA